MTCIIKTYLNMFLGRGVRINSQNIYSYLNTSFFSWHPECYAGATPLTLLIIFDLLNIYLLSWAVDRSSWSSRGRFSLSSVNCETVFRRVQTHSRTRAHCNIVCHQRSSTKGHIRCQPWPWRRTVTPGRARHSRPPATFHAATALLGDLH